MQIWKRDISLEGLNQLGQGNLVGHLGIEFSNFGDDFLEATMPVRVTNQQPMGLLHGGATATLAETLGSVASVFCFNDPNLSAVGIELNINHLKSARSGTVTGRVTSVKIGRSVHVWNIEVRNEKKDLLAVSRLTTMVIGKK